jgi:predicted peroxiredoxin
MSVLSIIVAGPEPDRMRSAVGLAAAYVATGGAARLFFDSAAVVVFADSLEDELRAMLDTCLDLGGEVIVCQSGLAAAGLAAEALDPRFTFGGMVGFVAGCDVTRLVLA